jgi:DNA invertase Pin-like site-specific DNA recombinase
MIGVLSPDRLARKYAYQVLLLEELGRSGCEIVFVDHPISDDPNDQLLLQIQGAIAAYERVLLGERFRRGKLQKAREGHFIGAKAPYGYRYVAKRDGVPGHLVLDETESELVRMLYSWLIEERMTVRQILKRLNKDPGFPARVAPVGRLRSFIISFPIQPTPARRMPTATATCRLRGRALADPEAVRTPAESSDPKRSGSPSPSRRS